MRRTPALILGGGPAGTAAAIRLARGGVIAELIERSTGPRDLVCGGFLGWDALAALHKLGLSPERLGARPIRRLRLVSRTSTVEAPLPRAAAGLSRRCLDEALMAEAVNAGVLVRRGLSVRAAEGRQVRLDNGEEIAADALFLATGKHELRGLNRPVEDDRPLSAGIRTSLPPSPALHAALDDHIELHLFDGGYGGLLLQEDGSANLCISVAPDRLSAGIPALLEELKIEAPNLAARLEGGFGTWEAIARVPYGWRAPGTAPGLYRLGDQSAVVASLAGDGVAIALTSGIGAAEAHLQGGGSAAQGWQLRFAAQARRPLAIAETLRRMAERRWPRQLLVGLARTPGLPALAARLTRIA